jgi:diguanylate cyclase (GGDEF)-like protein
MLIEAAAPLNAGIGMGTQEKNNIDSTPHLYDLLEIQQGIIANIALNTDLSETLEQICLGTEKIFENSQAMSSILLLHGDQLRHGAAPSIDPEYCQLIDGVKIGVSVGSCGTAAFSKARYIAEEIATDPKWTNFRDLANGFGLYACWSTPIMSKNAKVLGTFALYYSEPRKPTQGELEVIDRLTHLTGLAIENSQAHQRETELNERLQLSYGKVEAIKKVLPDQIFIYDDVGKCIDFFGSDNVKSIIPSKTLVGNLICSKGKGSRSCNLLLAIEKTLDTGVMQVFEYQMQLPDGEHFYESRITPIEGYQQDALHLSNVLWLARDITERKDAEKRIESLAHEDSLTRLPNRRFLLNQLQQRIETIKTTNTYGALLYIDLDNFKGVNDSLGHSAGDKLLVDICNRLVSTINPSDTFARIGGDEFVVLLSQDFKSKEDIEKFSSLAAEIMLVQLSRPFTVQNREIVVGASIGITLITNEIKHPDEVLMCADTAMYSAKRSVDCDYCFFDPGLHKSLKARFKLESELKEAIKLGQITTHFQPQIDCKGKILGVEALVRWFHPEKGMIPPMEFIAIAEQLGIVDGLQYVVMKDSCKLYRLLHSNRLIDADFKLSINMSAIQFKNPSLHEELTFLFQSEGVSPYNIRLELTESMLIEEIDSVAKQMNALKDKGFSLSIDDFGTGYSSLAYLQTLPIDELKIDKSFVDNMESTQVGVGIVETIITLADHLKFDVIAEGVETKAQSEFFKKKKILGMQGYYYAKPMPQDELHKWLLNQDYIKDKLNLSQFLAR